MLKESVVVANVPASDLGRARRFYADVLGLEPTHEGPGGLTYEMGGGASFCLYETEFAGRSGHTVAKWQVVDVSAEVKALRERGLEFEHYDIPGVAWDGDVAMIEGLGHAAWFTDSEGNIMCIDDATTG
ncbi:VOC family protein [Nocardioides sp.]|uniref:VOC family protein n=1 Tax=Nocardioides sp. TaxID=35761 RepID=UPI00286CE2B3|nr:VOC family protein [Nocardioides sp.]